MTQASDPTHRSAVDILAHYFPQPFLDLIAENAGSCGFEHRMIEGKGPQFKIGHLTTGPVGRKFVHLDSGLARAHEDHPKRLYGLATLPMHEPDLAVREVERASTLAGVRGFYVATHVLERELSDPAFFPVYERVEALASPIFLHPVEVIGYQRLATHHLRKLLGNPCES